MNWFDKIQKMINEPDDSRELKNGEVKNILLETFSKVIPEFKFNCYRNGCYYFSREKQFKEFPVYETLHTGFSMKEKNFYCSVSSCFDKTYEFSSSYNIGPLNLHKDLIAIVKNTGVIKIEDAYYFHNGKLNKTKNIIEKIADDYEAYGIKYLDDRFKFIEGNELLNIGLKYISNLSNNPEILKKELEDELKKAKYQAMRIEHPQYIELKRLLTNVKYGDKSERQGIPKLAYELLEYYCNKRSDDIL